jgi:hypothetical protein
MSLYKTFILYLYAFILLQRREPKMNNQQKPDKEFIQNCIDLELYYIKMGWL